MTDGFKEVEDFTGAETIRLGGRDKKTGKANPTKVEGYYLGTKKGIKSRFGDSQLHFFQTTAGIVGVWGKTDLDRKIASAQAGQLTRVEYTGKTVPSKKGNDMVIFKVSLHPSDFIEVNSAMTQSLNDEGTEDAGTFGDTEELAVADDMGDEEEALDDEPTYEDEVKPVRPSAPVRASAPSAERQAKVAAMLKGRTTVKSAS